MPIHINESQVGFPRKQTLSWGLVGTLLTKEGLLVSARKTGQGGRNTVDAEVELGHRPNGGLCLRNSGTLELEWPFRVVLSCVKVPGPFHPMH